MSSLEPAGVCDISLLYFVFLRPCPHGDETIFVYSKKIFHEHNIISINVSPQKNAENAVVYARPVSDAVMLP